MKPVRSVPVSTDIMLHFCRIRCWSCDPLNHSNVLLCR